MLCVCGKELTTTSATPWISCTIDSTGKVISGTCQHNKFFHSIRPATYKEYVDHMKEIIPKENQI